MSKHICSNCKKDHDLADMVVMVGVNHEKETGYESEWTGVGDDEIFCSDCQTLCFIALKDR